MLEQLTKAYNYLTGIGITADLPYIEKVRIRILNQTTWIGLAGAVLLFMQSRYLDRGDSIIEIICISLFTFPFLFHFLKNYFLPRLIATVIFPVFILALAITYGPKSSLQFIYFETILVALILYESKWGRFLNIIGIIFIFCINFIFWQNHGGLYPMKPSLFNDAVIFFGVTLSIASIVHNFFSEHKENYQKQLNYNNILADRNEKLEHYIDQNDIKNQLIQIVAHDLKNPAATFLNLTQKISYLIRNEEPNRLLEIANHIEASGTKFFYTLDNLLNWVISQQDGIKASYDYVDLGLLLEDLKKNLSFLLQPKQLKMVFLIPEGTLLYADPNMVKIILNNILHNAIKFSPANEKILVTYEMTNGMDKICITDFGKGMDARTQGIITQGENYFSTLGTGQEKGYGLGLKICYRMASFLNGNIEIKSKPGEGCQFIVSFPGKEVPELGKSRTDRKEKQTRVGQRRSDV